MYFTENLDKEALVLIKSDSDIKESYEAIKILSDDFQSKQEDALELDNMIASWLQKQTKKTEKETKPKPLKTPKPPKINTPKPPKSTGAKGTVKNQAKRRKKILLKNY